MTVYVTTGHASVTAIRAATGKVLKQIPTGPGPAAIAITPDGKTAYVTNSESASVTPIKIATNTALEPIKVNGDPSAIAITP